jgi:hypothetical protein
MLFPNMFKRHGLQSCKRQPGVVPSYIHQHIGAGLGRAKCLQRLFDDVGATTDLRSR